MTLVVLSPELVVFSIIWEKHLELGQTEALVCDYQQSLTTQAGLPNLPSSSNSYPDNFKSKLFNTNFIQQPLISKQKFKMIKILQFFFLLFPILIGVFVLLYDRYLVYRAVNFQQQVEMLERVWQQSIE